jgi:hypothetical protein
MIRSTVSILILVPAVISNYWMIVLDDEDSVAIANCTRDVLILGKLNEIVYVNVPQPLFSSIDLIIKLQPKVGVLPANPHIFAKCAPSLTFRDNRPYFRKAAESCGAVRPNILGSQGQRRKICTNADVG